MGGRDHHCDALTLRGPLANWAKEGLSHMLKTTQQRSNAVGV